MVATCRVCQRGRRPPQLQSGARGNDSVGRHTAVPAAARGSLKLHQVLELRICHEREAFDLRHGRRARFDPRPHTQLLASALDLREEGEAHVLLIRRVLRASRGDRR